MGNIRKKDPDFADKILDTNNEKTDKEITEEATKLFFQTKRLTPKVLTELSDVERGTNAVTTLGMLNVATEYYKDLYSLPALGDSESIYLIHKKVTCKLTESDRDNLNEKFTVKELHIALSTADKATAPGPDGLQYEVLHQYWDSLGPILTRTANDMMKTGTLPKCFEPVEITLIPKRDKQSSVDFKDLRPISLSNTALKVISLAVCNRLQQYRDKLIGPYQRGFMRNRHISQNTMEFNTMMQGLLKAPPDDPYCAVLMADFTKAFDRISHRYLIKVIARMGIKGGIFKILKSILTQQYARIQINNCRGPRFPLLRGTRQGNPLSPILFNIALEPLFYQLEELRGIDVTYNNILIHTMKYHAFADDANIYLSDEEDYITAFNALYDYEQASNSRVSIEKSKLLGVRKDFKKLEQDILPFEQLFLGASSMKYLGLNLVRDNWAKFTSYLPFMTHKQGFSKLDLISKAQGTNTFICSKTVYRDLVHPLADNKLFALDKAIQKTFRHVGERNLYARPKNGGYGLIHLGTQLLGHRAKVLKRVEDDEGWYGKYLRVKIVFHLNRLDIGKKKIRNSQLRDFDPYTFLYDKTNASYKKLEWTFTKTEIQYIRAWLALVPRHRTPREPLFGELREDQLQSLGEREPVPRDIPDAVRRMDFKGVHKSFQEKLPCIKPGNFLKICPQANEDKRWKKFWRDLYHLEWTRRIDLTAIHLFNHGSYVPTFDRKPQDEPVSVMCNLCCDSVREDAIQIHLYQECECTKYWWHELGFSVPMHLNSMLAPADTTFKNLRRLNWFVKIVRYTYWSKERVSELQGEPHNPLSPQQLKRAMNSVSPKVDDII
ncbi:uncharacterized protein CXQ87_003410 [Candidozyma duobushaemuli]|uniref:Reverse transcriptase domain-containing protein n=1 Tax=Candidozyma duobushaemuli TaxID=1231522 RepID=A0A2V1ADF0_9ASCO|nr:uncharacterized protein CXQ87_003410 [[Candida] duobushaemulonis]PVH15566.1 hypothetical protein CXQ87_003410 [[Candida] duobushaemulonis]